MNQSSPEFSISTTVWDKILPEDSPLPLSKIKKSSFRLKVKNIKKRKKGAAPPVDQSPRQVQLKKHQDPLLTFKSSLRTFVIDPFEFHVIMGLPLVDNISKIIDEDETKGVFAVVNVNSKITSTIIDKDYELLVMTLQSQTRPNTSWRYLYYRLSTLSDMKARTLALSLENFCLKIEQMDHSYVWLPKACDTICLKEKEYSLMDSKAMLSEEIKLFLQKFSDYAIFAFVRKKGPLKDENIELIVNQRLCDYIGVEMDELAYCSLRNGFPEIISPESYYEFWKVMFDQLEEDYTPVEIKLRTKSGGAKYALTQKLIIKKFYLEGEFYTVVVQRLEIIAKSSPNNGIACKTNEKLLVRSVWRDYEYLHSVLPFMERFYSRND